MIINILCNILYNILCYTHVDKHKCYLVFVMVSWPCLMVEATCAPIWEGLGFHSRQYLLPPFIIPLQEVSIGILRTCWHWRPYHRSHYPMGSLWHGFFPQASGTHTFPATLTRCLLTTCGEVWPRGLKLVLTAHIPWGGLKTTTFQQPGDPLMSLSTSRVKRQQVG